MAQKGTESAAQLRDELARYAATPSPKLSRYSDIRHFKAAATRRTNKIRKLLKLIELAERKRKP
jgi:hypothetical protein